MSGTMKENGENELIRNLEALHTTALGVERIKRNLSLEANDVVSWCKGKIKDPDSEIVRKGKNWYIRTAGCEITVNAGSYTIITAHKRKTG